MGFLLKMIGWIAAKTGLSTLMIQLILGGICCVGIVVAYNHWKNSIRDEAIQEYKVKEAKEIKKKVEETIAIERKALEERERTLDEKALEVATATQTLQQSRDLMRKELATKLTEVNKRKEVRDEEIRDAVRNIPDDKIDDAIRSFVAKYTTSSISAPAPN
jgi:hypothetical protein